MHNNVKNSNSSSEKFQHICASVWPEMLSLSIDALTTSPQLLFLFDCITLYLPIYMLSGLCPIKVFVFRHKEIYKPYPVRKYTCVCTGKADPQVQDLITASCTVQVQVFRSTSRSQK